MWALVRFFKCRPLAAFVRLQQNWLMQGAAVSAAMRARSCGWQHHCTSQQVGWQMLL
jgi:hypothetical protein